MWIKSTPFSLKSDVQNIAENFDPLPHQNKNPDQYMRLYRFFLDFNYEQIIDGQ